VNKRYEILTRRRESRISAEFALLRLSGGRPRMHRAAVASLIALLLAPAMAIAQSAGGQVGGAGPAVSAPNGKLSIEGGRYDGDQSALALGSYTIPLGYDFGLQADGAIGRIDEDTMGGGGLHLFARDPSSYLMGLYGSYHTWEGIDIWRLAAEFQLYLGRFSLDGLGGYEGVAVPETIGGLTVIDPHDDHAFGQLDLAYYPIDDLKLYSGYRYVNEASLGAAGVEYLMRAGGSPISLFAKADFGEAQYNRITGGLKVYLGPNRGKSLIARHRTEDPENYTPMFPRLSEVATVPQCTINGIMAVTSPSNGQCICPAGSFQAGYPPTLDDGAFVCFTPN
jgi:hypothetical protein